MIALARILAATDLSECSLGAVDYALFLAERLDATLDVLHVIDDDSGSDVYWFDPDDRHEPAEPYQRLTEGRQLSDAVTKLGVRTSVRVRGRLQFGAAAPTIAAAARDYHLVVMGTHGRHGIAHAVAGSVAEHVIRSAAAPVLTVCSRHIAQHMDEPEPTLVTDYCGGENHR